MKARPAREEPRWHAALAVAVALALYITLPPKIIVGPLWLLPMLIFVTLLPLMLLKPHRHEEAPWQRGLSIAHIAVLNVFNIATIVALFILELSGHHRKTITGEQLLLAAVQIWLTNVIVYALWFWELDGGGPDKRTHATMEQRMLRSDFLFPQMMLGQQLQDELCWRPLFLDYMFLSFTNATAFSPTDTYPTTRFAKVLMMGEGLTSLVTIAIIAGRAINILGS